MSPIQYGMTMTIKMYCNRLSELSHVCRTTTRREKICSYWTFCETCDVRWSCRRDASQTNFSTFCMLHLSSLYRLEFAFDRDRAQTEEWLRPIRELSSYECRHLRRGKRSRMNCHPVVAVNHRLDQPWMVLSDWPRAGSLSADSKITPLICQICSRASFWHDAVYDAAWSANVAATLYALLYT